MLHIEQLSKRYAGQSAPALDDVSLRIPHGQVFGLLGPNGAGKTTLLSILVGLVRPDSGRVLFEGRELSPGQRELRAQIGFVPQDFAFYPMLTVRENLAFFAAASGIERQRRETRIEFAVHATGLTARLDARAETLSGGYKRRLNLAIGLLNDPKILFLDEPTVGIDPQSRRFILDSIVALNRLGMTVIYTSHYMEEVQQICSDVAIIDRGRILASGPIDELLASQAGTQLHCGFSAPLTAHQRSELAQRFGARPSGATDVVIESHNPEALLILLGEYAQSQGLAIARLRYGYGNLETLFLDITAPDSTARDTAA